MITPVILCGGNRTLPWPLPRDFYPKQLLALTREQTLLQKTALYLASCFFDSIDFAAIQRTSRGSATLIDFD